MTDDLRLIFSFHNGDPDDATASVNPIAAWAGLFEDYFISIIKSHCCGSSLKLVASMRLNQ
jgi:hypothetical protein